MRRILALVFLVLSTATPALAAHTPPVIGERIISYDSHITLNANGSMVVTETIKVNAQRERIKRGVYRDFPTLYRGPWFTTRRVPFAVLSVERDGASEPHHTAGLENGKRIYIGSENVFLDPGVHTYRITYATGRQVGFFSDHDELYWNVTGNDWAFPIDSASATLVLPDTIPPDSLKLIAYTGGSGEKGADFTAELDADGRPRFETTRRLAVKEGLTIAIAWPKGHVSEPTGSERFFQALTDSIPLAVGAVGIILTLFYFLYTWVKVGVDPERGVIIPLFAPPEELSPAAARYLRLMGYDHKAFAAALINMAVKKRLTMTDDDGAYVLTKTENADAPLSPEENEIHDLLLDWQSTFRLERENHSRISTTIESLKKILKKTVEKPCFKRNTRYFIAGIILSLLTLIVAGLTSGAGNVVAFIFMCVWLSGWTVGVSALLYAALTQWRAVIHGARRVKDFGSALSVTAFSVPFLVGEGFGLFMLVKASTIALVPVIAAFVVLNLVFFKLLRAYTPRGRSYLDKLEGFRMYLSAAEKLELSYFHPPHKTPELFEKYLPYALALDVENEWAEQFAEVLKTAGEGGSEYAPSWYGSTGFVSFSTGSFVSSIGSSVASAVSSSSSAPGSSSGFGGGGGGGGSSGGGGGGGGGGGW